MKSNKDLKNHIINEFSENKETIFFVVTSNKSKELIELISLNKLNCLFDYSEIKGIELSIEGVRLVAPNVKIHLIFETSEENALDLFKIKDFNKNDQDQNLKVYFF